MRSISLAFLAVIFVLGPVLPQMRAEDWPTYRHDNRRSGSTAESLEVSNLAPAWVWASAWRPMPAWDGPADVDAYRKVQELGDTRNYDPAFFAVVVADRVYFGSSADDTVRCLDLATGEVVWRFAAGGPVRVAPTVSEDRVYFGSDDGFAYCIDAQSGEMIWRHYAAGSEKLVIANGRLISQWPCRSGVLVEDGTAWFTAGMLPWLPSYVCAVDAATGEVTGTNHFVRKYEEGHTPEAALLASSDRLFVPQGALGPQVIRKEDGEILGSLPGASTFAVLSPAAGLFSGPFSRDIGLRGTDAETQQQVAWHPSAREMLVDGDIYYLLAEGAVWAVNNADQTSLWSTPISSGVSLIRAGEHLYVGGDGQLWALDAGTGEIVWEGRVAGVAHGLVAANDALVVSTDEGTVEVFRVAEQADAAQAPPAEVEPPAAEGELAEPAESGTPVVPPYVQFVGPGTALIRWQTELPSTTIVDYSLGDETLRYEDEQPVTQHEARITGLRAGRTYSYRALGTVDGQLVQFGGGGLDTFFNFVLPPQPGGELDTASDEWTSQAAEILDRSGCDAGLAMIVGCEQGELARELARQSNLRVIVVEEDREQVEQLRGQWLAAGVYGPRLCVLETTSLQLLSLPGMLANLIVLDGKETGTASSEASGMPLAVQSRLLRPHGGVLYMSGVSAAEVAPWEGLEGFEFETHFDEGDSWALVRRGAMPGTADWSHQYGDGRNAGYTGETLAGSRAASDLELQWIGRPGPRYHADRQVRKPAPLCVAGRLFAQGQERVIALDAYSGTPLWSLELPGLQRYDIPHDASNWTADAEHLYVALADHCWQLDAETGELVRRLPLPASDRPEMVYDWGYIGSAGDLLLGSANTRGTNFNGWWGGAFWYDQESNTTAASDCLYAYDKQGGELLWSYDDAVIVNTSIVCDEEYVYFVESRDEETVANYGGRISLHENWPAPHLVALELATGNVVWRKPLEHLTGEAIFSAALSEGTLVTVGSSKGSFYIDAYRADNGELAWHREMPWGWRGHGGHYSRPVIVGQRLFVRPAVLDLATGDPLDLQMPGGGCGSYCASSEAVFYRSGDIAAWAPETEQVSGFRRLRPGCWLNAIPAGGLLLAPETGGGCSCGGWLEISAAFAPASYPPPSLKTRGRSFVDRMPLEIFNRVPGGEIHYTLDGSEPTLDSPLYTEPILIDDDVAMQAATFWPQASGPAQRSSTIAAEFTRSYPGPTITSEVVAFTDTHEVEIRKNGETGTMHFTLDGSEPTLDSPICVGTTIALADSAELVVRTIWQLPGGRIVESPPARKTFYRVVPRTPEEELRINFQHESRALPEGYEADSGWTYRVQPNGYTYGWTDDMRSQLKTRGDQENLLLCPFIECKPHVAWEIEVENGDYEVTVCIGEIFYGVENGTIYIEDVEFCKDVMLERYETHEYTRTVTVSDGRLTLTSHDIARVTKSTRLNYLHIRPVGGE